VGSLSHETPRYSNRGANEASFEDFYASPDSLDYSEAGGVGSPSQSPYDWPWNGDQSLNFANFDPGSSLDGHLGNQDQFTTPNYDYDLDYGYANEDSCPMGFGLDQEYGSEDTGLPPSESATSGLSSPYGYTNDPASHATASTRDQSKGKPINCDHPGCTATFASRQKLRYAAALTMDQTIGALPLTNIPSLLAHQST
jgi:hypothetical protein